MKLHVVLRTCDQASIESNRIVDKKECVVRCFESLWESLVDAFEYSNYNNTAVEDFDVKIFDDGSSEETLKKLKSFNFMGKFEIEKLNIEKDPELNSKQKSRPSLKAAYDYIYTLPDEDLVYIVEDDYMHVKNSIDDMLNAYVHFKDQLIREEPNTPKYLGIFPNNFRELYFDKMNPHNGTYVHPCYVFAGPDRYYRTTWFTHETFMVPVGLIKKYKEHFDALLDIGTVEGAWEGNTISNVWTNPEVVMLMPLEPIAIHLGKREDIPYFYENKWLNRWNELS
jgi:hypothetical protein